MPASSNDKTSNGMKAWSAKIWNKKYLPAKDITAFINGSPKEAQAKLKQLRKIIKAAVPKAEEGISYRMPAFKLQGKSFVGFAGYKQHIGFYPMSGSFLAKFKKELGNYKTSKGAIQFPLDKPLPVSLLKFVVEVINFTKAVTARLVPSAGPDTIASAYKATFLRNYLPRRFAPLGMPTSKHFHTCQNFLKPRSNHFTAWGRKHSHN
jgi:uncharacterized protein YdhG (YjbR/CyaY superfamily)